MSWLDTLRARAQAAGAPVCFGLDPKLDKIPDELGDTPGDRVATFYVRILERMAEDENLPAVVKPNWAYYEALGQSGMAGLERIVQFCKEIDLPVLADAKRGDIGRTSEAYAHAIFDGYAANAVTVNGYMGSDSLEPFTNWCELGRGVYVLCRTSNPGALELQDLPVDGRPLYLHLAEHVAGPWFREGIGVVLGATAPGPLTEAARLFKSVHRDVALLLPGIGAQGGSAQEVAALLKEVDYDLDICLFSASSSVAFAGHALHSQDFAGAASRELRRLKDEIRP